MGDSVGWHCPGAVAASGDGDDFGVMEQPVEDGAGGRDVAQELSPFFDGTIGGHQVERFS